MGRAFRKSNPITGLDLPYKPSKQHKGLNIPKQLKPPVRPKKEHDSYEVAKAIESLRETCERYDGDTVRDSKSEKWLQSIEQQIDEMILNGETETQEGTTKLKELLEARKILVGELR